MTNTRKVKVACVGAGYFSQFHYESWSRMTDVDLQASCDLEIEKAKATGVSAYTNLPKMLTACKPDILDVILPPNSHVETIKTALSHGIKWVICQKPFCPSLEQAEAIVAMANAEKATIIIHENFRFQPWFRTIKSVLDRGGIGTPLQATFRLRPGDGQGPNAYLDRQPYFQKMPKLLVHETGVHYIDTFRFLFGSPSSVYADLRKINPVISGEDAGHVLLNYDNGMSTLIDGNRCLDHAADNLRRTMGEALVEGTEGTLTLTGDGSVRLRAFAQQKIQVVLPADKWDGFGGDCVHALQSHVISGFMSGTPIENIAQEYLEVLRTEEAVYASNEAGKKIKLDKK